MIAQAASIIAIVAAVGLGAAVYLSLLFGLWRLEGRPSGIERRLIRLLNR